MKPLVKIEREECLQIDRALSREWLETNGLGGYASSTVLMCPTRRYHGLLVSPLPGEMKRFLFLARFEETLSGRGKSFPLSMARYPGLWFPHGHQAIESVGLTPYPSFLYRIGDAWIRREILMVQGARTVLVRYSVENVDTALELRLAPLYAFREADALTGENMGLDPRTERLANGFRSRPYAGLPPLAITFTARNQRFEADPVWHRRIEFTQDLELGYAGHEDQFSPGHSRLEIAPGADVVVAASIDGPVADPAALWARESAARARRCEGFDGSLGSALQIGADHFLYRLQPKSRLGVLAGFPWHGEVGQDTFLALPGILLSRGEVETCGQALQDALPFLRRGLMPSSFGPTPERSQYESASASLWFARAVRLYEQAGGSKERVFDVLRPALEAIAWQLHEGTDLDVGARDGLLRAGSDERGVTWMNAATSAGPVTPRAGFAVEINALWYFLLSYIENLEGRRGDAALEHGWRAKRERAGKAFLERFWLDDVRYLADLWKDGAADRTIRPNMVIASALEFSPLSRHQRLDVFEWARAELFTQRGLRTLAPEFDDYRGAHRGDPEQRERARHQGCVFPWLSSFYVETYLRALSPSQWELEPLSELVLGFVDLLHGHGLNQVSELYDGDPPHRPGGAIAQAVNTSELLRALHLFEEPPQ